MFISGNNIGAVFKSKVAESKYQKTVVIPNL
jgi:hypothetical protein